MRVGRSMRPTGTTGQTAMRPFLIMGHVLIEVALWQWRVVVTGRGQLVAEGDDEELDVFTVATEERLLPDLGMWSREWSPTQAGSSSASCADAASQP